MAQAADRVRRAGRVACARRHRGRVHRRLHRARWRPWGGAARGTASGSSHPTRSAPKSAPRRARRGVDARPQRGRPHHQAADPGHDRSRPPDQPASTPGPPPTTKTPSRVPFCWARRSGRRPRPDDAFAQRVSAVNAESPVVLKRRPPASGSSPWSRPGIVGMAGRRRPYKIEGLIVAVPPPGRALVDEIIAVPTEDAAMTAGRREAFQGDVVRRQRHRCGSSGRVAIRKASRRRSWRLRPQVPEHRRTRRRYGRLRDVGLAATLFRPGADPPPRHLPDRQGD